MIRFADYGQCNNLEERADSSWWTEHTRSFAMRQMGMYEREMGWSFWTWKLEDQLGEPSSSPPPLSSTAEKPPPPLSVLPHPTPLRSANV